MANLSVSTFQKEVDENAFLVSKTDTHGRITYCNEPFLKIVVATEKELLGKPHNIIRHPDMPRIIFKILWDHITKQNEVFAYVKNRSFDNSYYWVFANITASVDQSGKTIGYYSVRRKPNQKALDIIIPLYKDLLEAEKTGGMKNSQKLLDDILAQKNLGYDEFVNNLQRL